VVGHVEVMGNAALSKLPGNSPLADDGTQTLHMHEECLTLPSVPRHEDGCCRSLHPRMNELESSAQWTLPGTLNSVAYMLPNSTPSFHLKSDDFLSIAPLFAR
jgi:hypothetical protein